ncbi:MAG: hypothetical protein KGS48_13300 [Bacteroidetes bacterium]|nr:hypothetical protein [Bacteroidota bacterium]
MKQLDLMRVLRAGMAVWAFYLVFTTADWIMLPFGILFGVQAWFNMGCCGVGGCAPNHRNPPETETSTVQYEEVRNTGGLN